jgi:hypothetical protein
MVKDWRKVKEEIEAEIDDIWLNEPEEIKKSRLGIFPSGAGVYGQYFGNIFFISGDIRAIGYWVVEPSIMRCLDSPDFTLDHCKKLFEWLTFHVCELLGGTYGEKCPAPWLNMGTLYRLCKDILASYDTIKTKEEFKELLVSWYTYVNRLYRWSFFMFPWHLGLIFQRVEPENVKELAKLVGLK